MEDNAVALPVLEPGDIDDPLDDGVSKWMMGSPTEVRFLYAYRAQRATHGEADKTNTVYKSHVGQQALREFCIVADAFRSTTRAKPIHILHGVHNLRLRVPEKAHAINYKLRIM